MGQKNITYNYNRERLMIFYKNPRYYVVKYKMNINFNILYITLFLF